MSEIYELYCQLGRAKEEAKYYKHRIESVNTELKKIVEENSHCIKHLFDAEQNIKRIQKKIKEHEKELTKVK